MPDPKIVKVLRAEGKTRMYEMEDGSILEREGGHANWRNNNPGNLKFELPKNASEETVAKRLKEAQSRYAGIVGLDENGMAIFETPQAGRQAQVALADRRAAEKPEWTLENYVKFYAKDDYAGTANHAAYLRKLEEVGRQNGVDLSKDRTVASLNDKEKSVLVDAMKTVEGTKVGATRTVYTPTSDYSLKYGDTGKDVDGLRTRLAQAGYQNFLDPQGYYGYSTYEAVRRFQKDNGLPETGTADIRTLNVLGNKFPAKDGEAPGFMRADADTTTTKNPTTAVAGGATSVPTNPSTTAAVNADANPATTPTRTDAATLADPAHPRHALYAQALTQVEALRERADPPLAGDPRQLAAATAAAAAEAGMTRIDRLERADDGRTLFAVQGRDPSAPQATYARIDAAAQAQGVDESTRRADAVAQAVPAPRAPGDAREQDTPSIRPLSV